MQFSFIVNVYSWTGARIGAFFTGDLNYRDITLGSQRDKDNHEKWRLIYRLDQQRVKSNRDPENSVFSAACKEHKNPVFSCAGFLLSMAVADGALKWLETIADVRSLRIPRDKDVLEIQWKSQAMYQPIFRKCTQKDGVTNEPMPHQHFVRIFRQCLLTAGYNCSASVHAIRRGLGERVDQKYTDVQRS